MSTATSVSQIVGAPPQAVYDAFMDPDTLIRWLPPAGLTGKFHEFDGRVGGGYRMSLFYGDSEQNFRGKTAEREDLVRVRFVELVPAQRIVEAVTFVSDDAAFGGEMTITVTFEPVAGGTEVIFLCENLPPGLRPEDNEAGSRLSLEQLARLFA